MILLVFSNNQNLFLTELTLTIISFPCKKVELISRSKTVFNDTLPALTVKEDQRKKTFCSVLILPNVGISIIVLYRPTSENSGEH